MGGATHTAREGESVADIEQCSGEALLLLRLLLGGCARLPSHELTPARYRADAYRVMAPEQNAPREGRFPKWIVCSVERCEVEVAAAADDWRKVGEETLMLRGEVAMDA